MFYSLIIAFGLLFAIRGVKSLTLQYPEKTLPEVWRQAVDFCLTLWFILLYFEAMLNIVLIRAWVQDHALILIGFLAYVFSKYQKKSDIFFLSISVLIFLIHREQANLPQGLFMATVVSVGIALFRTCFLGLRYKLLFSKVPKSMRGWPILFLLASFLSLALWKIGALVF